MSRRAEYQDWFWYCMEGIGWATILTARLLTRWRRDG